MSLSVMAGSPVVGRSLAELGFPDGAIVGAILRAGGVIVPSGDDVLRVGDSAIVFALPDAVKPVIGLFPS
jgi:trk system potassium uptake protein TrkA